MSGPVPRTRDGSVEVLVGPPGFEPGTKGFAYSICFQTARTISSPANLWPAGAGRSSLLSRALEAPR